MIALDTNVLVRALTLDDAKQAAKAKRWLGHTEGVFLAKTVLLELEWVLRAAYRLPPGAIHDSLLRLCGLPQVHVEQADQVAQALDDFADGMDFADALHLAAAQVNGGFYSFDAALVRTAKRLGRLAKAA